MGFLERGQKFHWGRGPPALPLGTAPAPVIMIYESPCTASRSNLKYCFDRDARTVQGFSMGRARLKGRRPRAESGVLGEGAKTLHSSWGVWEIAVSSPAGFGAAPRPPEGFPLLSAFRMASPDTIMLLIVDYHKATGGGASPRAPPLRTPLRRREIWAGAPQL